MEYKELTRGTLTKVGRILRRSKVQARRLLMAGNVPAWRHALKIEARIALKKERLAEKERKVVQDGFDLLERRVANG